MEEFDDDDCSDLYADVVVQASSAISAMHRLTEMRHVEDEILDNATRREMEVRDGFRGRSHKTYEHVSECENGEAEDGGDGGLTNLPLENGDMPGSESEDDLDSGSDDEYKQKKDENCESDRHDNRRREGGPEYEEEEEEKRRGGIDAKEKSVNGGDHNLRRKSLKYDSLSSKKNRVDEMGCNAHKSSKKRDEELFTKRDIEDIQSRPNNVSGSCRPMSLDKRGSVQISDSVEDNHHKVSDYSSDGMTTETSKDTYRRKRSSTFDKVSSPVDLESSESDWSQRGRGSSCSPSPHVALEDKHIGKSNKYSRHPSSSLDRELQEEITHEYHPSKDYKRRANKRGTGDGRYCDRQRGVTWKHSHQPRKSSDVPYLKNRWTNGDTSYSIDVTHPHTRNVQHGKQRAMHSFESSRNNVPYHSHSERVFTPSSRFLPDNRLGPAYLKNQYPSIHRSCRYKQSWSDDLNMSERQIFHEKNINKMDYKASGDDWQHYHRRHIGQANIKGSRKLTPKYSSPVNQRGTQFSYEVDEMQFRRRAKDDYLSPLHESDNKFVEGKYRRIGPTSGRDRDHLDHVYGRNIVSQTYGRGKRRCDSSLNRSDNIWYETNLNDRRNMNGRPFPFFSPEEPYAPRRGQYPGSSGPKSGVPERNMRCLWKEQHIGNGWYGIDIATSDNIESARYRHSEDHLVRRRHYQQFSDTYVMNESIKDDYEDNFFRRRHHQHSEVLHSREESRHQGDTIFHSEEPSYHFEKISKNNRADDRRAFGHVEEHIDERGVNRVRTKMIREQDCSSQFDGYHKSIQPHSHAQMHPRYQESIDQLVVVGRKCTMQSSRRTPEAGDDTKNAVLTNEEKVDISLGDINQLDESLDIEEGQIISEDILDRIPLDDEKIREIMVKMERRKMRFKEPVTTCRDSSVKASYLLPDLNVESDTTKLDRPSRKRRWSGT
ncbi:hypothetical protein ACS0TY_027752 [Phlomoides rotata]